MNALTRSEIASFDAPVVRFDLNGRIVEAPANRTLIEIADAEGIEIPRLCYKPGLDKVGNCRACMVEIAGERVLAPSCCRTPTDGMKVTTDSERARKSQTTRPRAAALGHARSRVHAPQRARRVGRPARRRQAALRSASAGRTRPVASGDGGEPVGVHPVHALRARLPRRAGQRRDRPRLPRQRREDRLRHGRPDGQLHVRRLRRMRAGLPDRSADAGARRRADGPRQAGRIALPVLRRRLPADLQRQGQPDPLRRGPRRPRQPWAAVRQGPLRLRLRAPSAAPARAADPPPRRAQGCRRRDGPRARSRHLPRGDVGRSARARRRQPRTTARRARPEGARRLRLGQGQQRRGLPVPEAGSHGLSQQQRRPLHAAVPRIERRRAARRASARARSRTR